MIFARLIEQDRADDSVWYELISLAYPPHIFAQLGTLIVTLFQRKFAVDSPHSMVQAVTKN